ncbi:MAG TPA: lysine--tRNA ligase [Candidatus Nanopelagicaceae bacterium]|nr:lysine--tRNA ligase [Candidatus Nanopelagicaceae bacterium]
MNTDAGMPIDEDLPEQLRIRRDKRARLLEDGVQPYPVSVPRTSSLAYLRERFGDLATDSVTGKIESVVGRVIFKRDGGKLAFATVREGAGAELQVMLSLDKVGEAGLDNWKSLVDIGDIVSVTGEVITSKRGELSVLANSWQMAAKALRPLPIEHKPLSEETRVRMRYVDLIMRPEARENARMRPLVMRALRDSFAERDFIEVETPMLQVMHGGASARPFKTHINAYDMDLYLRIAPELYLKRCVVGGIERVFEINRNFRNEGADSSHSPEFAMIEAYESFGDWNSIAEITKSLVQEACLAAYGSLVATRSDGTKKDFGGEWGEISLFGAVSEALGKKVDGSTSRDVLLDYAAKINLAVDPKWSSGRLAEEMFEHLCKDQLLEPTFVRGYPVDTSPLVREHRSEVGVVEKWDLYVDGFELATGYSELVDPVIQRERLTEQSLLAAGGDSEAMQLDEDFLRAMEFGMPPMGGMGMGVDRLLMALTGLGIRETILFPLVKPE